MNQSNRENQQLDLAGAGAVAVDTSARPLPLNADCLEEIFDYLALDDIYTISGTCKWMRQFAGYYFKQNFHGAKCEMEDGYIYLSKNYGAPRNGFSPFMSKLYIERPVKRLKTESFSSLKHIAFYADLNTTQLDYMKDILKNVETLVLFGAEDTRTEMYEQLLSHCTKLKRLKMDYCDLRRFEITQNWLQTTPTLEFLGLRIPQGRDAENINLISILTQNPNVKRIEINAETFWTNRNSFVEANIQLDCLTIKFGYFTGCRHIADILLKLNERGFYKTLRLDFYSEEFQEFQEFSKKVASLSALQVIEWFCLKECASLSPLIYLKELSFLMIDDDTANTDMNIVAKNLVNLEKLSAGFVSIDIVIPFLRHSRKLKIIKVDYLKDGAHFENNILDLTALNKQRQKLDGAQKVSICVEEKVYLATKWAMKHWNFGMVEIKRKESVVSEKF